MSNLQAKEYKTFEWIKHVEDGGEFWYARELGVVLEYVQWRNFVKVIDRAKLACKNSGYAVRDHFAEVSKIVEAGVTSKPVIDYDHELAAFLRKADEILTDDLRAALTTANSVKLLSDNDKLLITVNYQLNLDRNLGKTNPLSENDLTEFVKVQKTKADSDNSWSLKIADVDTGTWDLSVKNPNRKDETVLREPKVIIDEIKNWIKNLRKF